MTSGDQIARLERRYLREHRARIEAEAIAEAGLLELSAVNASLDERIRERTAELEAAMAKANAANAAKDAFLAHVSHELRTPLNGLTGMLELLESEVSGTPASEWLTTARDSGQRLLRLVERLLSFTDLRSADLAAGAQPMIVKEIADEAAERWRLPCAKVGQLLSVDPMTAPTATVLATPDIHRALDELLDNTVAHGPSGAVTITTRAMRDHVRFEVADPGDGPPQRTARILDTGQEPSTRHGMGAGIGLALATRIAESLGGSLGSGQTEEGKAVWISVPRATSTHHDPGTANR